jgi:GxxExxY protein
LSEISAHFETSGAGISIAQFAGVLTLPQADDPRTYAIIGAALEVHRVLGTGFLELLYKDALQIELNRREIPFLRELPCNISYKGHQLRGDYKVDFVCFDGIVLEIKARSLTGPADHAQVISYLAATKLSIGLLLNFGTAKLEHRRFIRTLD